MPASSRSGFAEDGVDCDVKEATVGDDVPAAVHLQVGMSMKQWRLSSAGVSLRFGRTVTWSGLDS